MHSCSPGVHAGDDGQLQLLQAQLDEQVSLPYVLHCCMAGGSHAPWSMQPPVCQVPMLLHVCVSEPQLPQAMDCTSPSSHTPVHTPAAHVCIEQGTAVPHVPLESHVSTPLPEHCVSPAAQTPVHAPETHV
jgi:hypothetical protein